MSKFKFNAINGGSPTNKLASLWRTLLEETGYMNRLPELLNLFLAKKMKQSKRQKHTTSTTTTSLVCAEELSIKSLTELVTGFFPSKKVWFTLTVEDKYTGVSTSHTVELNVIDDLEKNEEKEDRPKDKEKKKDQK